MRLIKGLAWILVALALVVCTGAEASGKKGTDKDCRWIWITGSNSAGMWGDAPPAEDDPALMNQCYGDGFANRCQFWGVNPSITGTVKGEWVMCGNETWGVTANPSGLPLTGQFWTNPGFLRTRHGVVCLAEQSVVGSRGDFTALEEVTGGTGIYAGMTGWLANQKPITAATKRFSFAGWICRP
jgi:hypothetical protein